MKVLYAIQGTGNGHLSRAKDIVPVLADKVDLDLLISGIQADVPFPYDFTYRYKGMSFIFGKKGGVDLWKTWKKTDTKKLFWDVLHLPVRKYDLIINDFEPVSAWAAWYRKVPCVALSHQAAVSNKYAPKPQNPAWFPKMLMKYYAISNVRYGFHFRRYDVNIFTPVIRKEIRESTLCDKGHYTVYLPSYSDDKLLQVLTQFHEISWEVFSKHTQKPKNIKNVTILPICNERFISSISSCTGVLCGAGFETPAEALSMGKKLMVVPMKSQYEQQCNAIALKDMGVPVIKNLKKKQLEKIREWINSSTRVAVNYPDNTEYILNMILENHSVGKREMGLENVLA